MSKVKVLFVLIFTISLVESHNSIAQENNNSIIDLLSLRNSKNYRKDFRKHYPALDFYRTKQGRVALDQLLVKSATIPRLHNVKSIKPVIDPRLLNLIEQRANNSNGYYQKEYAELLDYQKISRHIEEASHWYVVTFRTSKDANAALRLLTRRGIVAEYNNVVEAHYIPSDTYYNSFGTYVPGYRDTWNFDLANFPAAWNVTRGDSQIITAVLDTGVDINHPDLGSRMWRNPGEPFPPDGIDNDANGFIDDFQGWDFTTGVAWHGAFTWEDYYGHGTGVAGIIASDSDNARGIPGGSFNGKFMNLRVLDSTGGGTVANIASAIAYATAMGADVINMSLGSAGFFSSALQTQVALAEAAGIAVFASAGNMALETRFMSPANIRETIAVGATTHGNNISSFSNYGFATDIFAGGGGLEPPASTQNTIVVPLTSRSYGAVAGTSISSPLAASVANLQRALQPGLTGLQIRQALRGAALQRSRETGIVDDRAYGDLDAQLALSIGPLPEVRITSPDYYNNKFESSVVIEGFVRAPGGVGISAAELTYREVGASTSSLITTLGGAGNFSYAWNMSGLPDGEYYAEVRALGTLSPTWSIDTVKIRKGPKWYVNNSDPGLSRTYSLGIEGVDIDSDGDRDLVIPKVDILTYLGLPPGFGIQNTVLINDGNGNFTEDPLRFRRIAPAPIFSLRLIPADLNNDGHTDFVDFRFVSVLSDDIYLYINDGTGYFDEQAAVPGLGWTSPTFGAVGDTDGDGDEDILVADLAGTRCYFLRNDGTLPTGRIQMAEIFLSTNLACRSSTGAAQIDPVMGDIDGDGDRDVMLGGVYINQGGNFFTDATSAWFSPGAYSDPAKAVDMDNDGDLDLISTTKIMLNQGGNFRSDVYHTQRIVSSGIANQLEIGDIDRDGLPDVIINEYYHLHAYRNAGFDPSIGTIRFENKSFEWLPDSQFIGYLESDAMDFYDREGDGDLDIAIVGIGGIASFMPGSLTLLDMERAFPAPLRLGDVNGDGQISIIDSLLVAQYAAGLITLSPAELARGDVNQSGTVDILDALIIARIAAGLIPPPPPPPGPAAPAQEYCAKVPCPY